MKSKFSVLMSIYNKENPLYFSQCLESIQQQTLNPNEIVIVQDGPLSKSLVNIIKIYKNKLPIKLVKLKHNVGLANALNEGLKYCSYEYVVRVDTDDINLPNRFKRNILFLDKGYVLVGSNIEEFSNDSQNLFRIVPSQKQKIKKFCRYRNPFNHMTVAFKKSVIIKYGSYSDEIPFKEDYFLWIKLISSNEKICNIDEVLVRARFDIKSLHRRSGFSYALSEVLLQKKLYISGISNLNHALIYGSLRFLSFLMPLFIKKLIYRIFFRRRGLS